MIGYYVHHRGEGHGTRAAAIAAQLGVAHVTGLSSRPRPDGWAGPWVELDRDDVPAPGPDADPTAGDALHWAPAGHAGLRSRMAQIAAWVAATAPRLVVVDVSVEVTALVRAMGVPVVVMAMPGARSDPAHQLAYRLAEAIIAPWPSWAEVLSGGATWRDKTHHVGAISRFDGRPRRVPDATADAGRRVLVVSGRGGTGLTTRQLAGARRATPGWDWTVLGPPGERWVADPWPLLCGADVVVTHAGQNAIADVAAAGRPTVVVPQERPHGEQAATARALGRAGLASVCSSWPAPARWEGVLTSEVQTGGAAWGRWSSGTGARRAAAVLRRLLATG